MFDRCETADDCSKSKLDPIMKFYSTGKMVKSFGGGMINYPHGLHIDPDNNVWVTDGRAMNNGKGHTVMKFDQDGKLLMTLGKPGIAGTTQDTFNSPSDVLVTPNGDIFVADGHGGNTNNRIVKFTKDGKYIKEWGKKGTGPGEFDAPHRLAMDSAGRLFVADRSNNRIQVFDQDGKFLLKWKQFGRPSGLFIDKNDVLYVADNSPDELNPPYKSGIRIGSVKDGVVKAFILESVEVNGLEAVAVDDAGNVYGGYQYAELPQVGAKEGGPALGLANNGWDFGGCDQASLSHPCSFTMRRLPSSRRQSQARRRSQFAVSPLRPES